MCRCRCWTLCCWLGYSGSQCRCHCWRVITTLLYKVSMLVIALKHESIFIVFWYLTLTFHGCIVAHDTAMNHSHTRQKTGTCSLFTGLRQLSRHLTPLFGEEKATFFHYLTGSDMVSIWYCILRHTLCLEQLFTASPSILLQFAKASLTFQ